jgi:hypothetical protein
MAERWQGDESTKRKKERKKYGEGWTSERNYFWWIWKCFMLMLP